MKKLLCILLCILSFLSLCACTVGTEPDEDSSLEDNTIPDINIIIPEETSSKLPQNIISADTNWLNAYALEYSYYDKKTGESEIAEARCGKYFQSLDYASNTVTFYSQEDGYILQYMLNPESKKGTVAVVAGSAIDNLYSGFSMLSACDPYFPLYKNVARVGTDFIAERPAARYRQTQTENGITTKIAYVWIDEEYGFASKCEQYNAITEELEMRWELLSFTQNVTEEKIKIDISSYSITEDG